MNNSNKTKYVRLRILNFIELHSIEMFQIKEANLYSFLLILAVIAKKYNIQMHSSLSLKN